MTSLSFMVYGPVSDRDMAVIAYAIYDQLQIVASVIIEKVNEEMAEVFDVNRGWNIQWVIGDDINPDSVIELIKEGLNHLKLEYKFYGELGGENSV